MTIQVINETETQMNFSYEEVAQKVILETLDAQDFPFEATVEVTLVSKETIQEINREQRDIDRVTDVLSFPMISYFAAGDFTAIEECDDNFDPDSGEALLGDIVICLDKVTEQAQEYGHSEEREFAFLVCHSMLHLLGYDHMTSEEEAVMFQRQEDILQSLGITREDK